MTKSNNDIVFDQNACPSLDHMIQYKAGSMDDLTARALEKHVLGCSMCEEVFDYVQHDNVAEMTALTASIDKKIEGRIASTGGSSLNFNQYMAFAASFIGVLIVVGNLLINTHSPEEFVKTNVANEHVDQGIVMEGKDLLEHEVVTTDDGMASELFEEAITDSVVVDAERRVALLSEVEAETYLSEVETGEASSVEEGAEQITQAKPSSTEVGTSQSFLLASITMLSVESLGLVGGKGTTDKKISKGKKRSNQGYAPSYDEDEGYPLYSGGDKKLREDIIQKINDLNLVLAEGGEVEIRITVAANGTVGRIKVDDKVSVTLASQLKSAMAKLPPWVPGNVKIEYTLKVRLR